MTITPWYTIRKTKFGIHISYAKDYTNNLRVENLQWRLSPDFEISLDINGNLRTKNKQESSYIDARELADGKINNLEMLQISDHAVVKAFLQVLNNLKDVPEKWILLVSLNGMKSFTVKPELKGDSLFLYVSE